MSVSSDIAPAGTETTMTALAWLLFDGVGGSLGGWTSAALYQRYGGAYTFQLYGWASLAGAAVIYHLQHKLVPASDVNSVKVSVC